MKTLQINFGLYTFLINIFVKNNTMLQINETQLKELEAYLLELPAKYANPIFQFLGNLAKEQGLQLAEAPKED